MTEAANLCASVADEPMQDELSKEEFQSLLEVFATLRKWRDEAKLAS